MYFFKFHRENVGSNGFNQASNTNTTADGTNIATEKTSPSGIEGDNFAGSSDDSKTIKQSGNDGLADTATPDDVLSLIDY